MTRLEKVSPRESTVELRFQPDVSNLTNSQSQLDAKYLFDKFGPPEGISNIPMRIFQTEYYQGRELPDDRATKVIVS
jgi:hypothetical protein